jgi:hypothetical protein
MNYEKIYNSLIERGKSRKLYCYVEKHHIVPRCLGGSDDIDNLVELTPEEHYVAHQLLVKIYPGNHKLIRAAAMMIPDRPSNKMYGWVRRRFSRAQSDLQKGSGNSQFGTFWIHNPVTGESKKTNGNIDEGWVKGRKPKRIKKEKNIVQKEKLIVQKRDDTELYREYYKIYSQVGFEKFVEITGYKFSKPNLVQRFKSLLPEFVPQNGKKRGS